jgi:hypothetical protein
MQIQTPWRHRETPVSPIKIDGIFLRSRSTVEAKFSEKRRKVAHPYENSRSAYPTFREGLAKICK